MAYLLLQSHGLVKCLLGGGDLSAVQKNATKVRESHRFVALVPFLMKTLGSLPPHLDSTVEISQCFDDIAKVGQISFGAVADLAVHTQSLFQGFPCVFQQSLV